MSFVESLPILPNFLDVRRRRIQKQTGQRYGYACAGHASATLKYELITDELCLTAASVGGEYECKTMADSE